MTARHSPLFTLESGQSGLGIYTSQRDAAALEPQPVDQADRVVVDAMTSLLDPQSLSRPTLLWNRRHGDD
jgi:hypothetical protein